MGMKSNCTRALPKQILSKTSNQRAMKIQNQILLYLHITSGVYLKINIYKENNWYVSVSKVMLEFSG